MKGNITSHADQYRLLRSNIVASVLFHFDDSSAIPL